MGSLVRWNLGIRAWISQQASSRTKHASFYHTPIPANILTPPVYDYSPPPLSSQDAKGIANHHQLAQLSALLARDRPSSTRVWEMYCTLGNAMGFDQISVDVHKQALRKAVPPLDKLLATNAKRIQSEHSVLVPHLYEKRLQKIISNIREAGHLPDMSDYHFVLEQFAAVGYYQGAMSVFREVVYRMGMTPTYKTYGLCLQALVHRLDLPCPYRFKKVLHADATRLCFELMDDMWERRISFTSVNFDLFHRVFKYTENFAFYERLLKVAYGLDLSFPDRFPLEIQQGAGVPTTAGGGGVLAEGFQPLPFSTSALNTLIDLLGSRKLIPKMVTAFEVLTAPLPKPPSSPSSSFEEDEDDDDPAFFEFSPGNHIPDLAYPSAAPNTSTFIFLIRHAANAKRVIFARHYFLQAQDIYQREMERLREELFVIPLEDIGAPAINVNRGMFLPIHGYANHEKKRRLMAWLYRQTGRTIYHKRLDLDFLIRWRERFIPASAEPRSAEAEEEEEEEEEEEAAEGAEKGAEEVGTRPSEDIAMDQSNTNNAMDQSNTNNAMDQSNGDMESTSSSATAAALDPTPGHPLPTPTYFSSNHSLEETPPEKIDSIALPPPPPPPRTIPPKKPYSIDIHIQVLQRDIEELDSLHKRMKLAHTRIDVRLMEKYGRRVWRKQDIYIPSEGRRVHIDRKTFLSIVRFGNRPSTATIRRTNDPPPWMDTDHDRPPHQRELP